MIPGSDVYIFVFIIYLYIVLYGNQTQGLAHTKQVKSCATEVIPSLVCLFFNWFNS